VQGNGHVFGVGKVCGGGAFGKLAQQHLVSHRQERQDAEGAREVDARHVPRLPIHLIQQDGLEPRSKDTLLRTALQDLRNKGH
jgi:hypothetical protein